MMNQDMGKVLIIRQSRFSLASAMRTSSNLAPDAHVIEFVLHAEQTGCDISKAFPTGGQLCKEQTKIMIKTNERLSFVVALVALDASTKVMKRQMVKKLSKNCFPSIHRSFLVEEL